MSSGSNAAYNTFLTHVSKRRWEDDADLKGKHDHAARSSWMALFSLSFQTLGVVYGDIGTSPLYVVAGTFEKGHPPTAEDALGTVSLIIWTLFSLVVVKYALIVLWADDNGNGGAFALFSLIRRAAAIALDTQGPALPSDFRLTRYSYVEDHDSSGRDWRVAFGRNWYIRKTLQLMVVIGVGFILGDGVMTPAISVLSATEALKVGFGDKFPEAVSVGLTIVILIVLFSIQRYGTHRVSGVFAPVITIWLLLNAGVGIYNMVHFNPTGTVLAAVSPLTWMSHVWKKPLDAFHQLSGVLLCVTGTEALFADLGHFSRPSIQLSCCGFVFPCLLLTYLGQGAYLTANLGDFEQLYWRSVPQPLFWLMFVVGTLATVTASQALISAVFSIVSQAISQGFFPKFEVKHTSKDVHGQVYIPLVNNVMMTLTVTVVAVFRQSSRLGHAYGIAVISDMFLTTCFMAIVMALAWRSPWPLTIMFALVFGLEELLFLCASASKVLSGGWFSLLMACVWGFIMYTWNWGTAKKMKFYESNVRKLKQIIQQEVNVSGGQLQEALQLVATGELIKRYEGVGLYYSESIDGVPPVLLDFIQKVPALPRIVVFLTNRRVSLPEVQLQERILLEPLSLSGFYHCVARYGYMEAIKQDQQFSHFMLASLVDLLLQSRDFQLHRSCRESAELPSLSSWGSFQSLLEVQRSRDGSAHSGSKSHSRKHGAGAGAGNSSGGGGVEEVRVGMAPDALPADVLRPLLTQSSVTSPFFQNMPSLPYQGLPLTRIKEQGVDELTAKQMRVAALEHEAELVMQQAGKRIIYVFGKSHVRARPGSNPLRRFMLEQPYQMLVNNFSPTAYEMFETPIDHVVEVAQVYYL